ncbi:propionyl-coenzyme A carboxylase alpha polypeptide [Mesorhizobium sp. M7A.F.Ca.CA.001.13.2.1]|nr:propionyl-coenzyme A carboxylase alpha polypeptide [Mesorhizobium sp. M7A.F.Ca.CA.001.13.2.1]
MPDISPSRGEIGSFGLIALFFIAENWRKPLLHPISPLEGEMSGRTEGGAVPPFL